MAGRACSSTPPAPSITGSMMLESGNDSSTTSTAATSSRQRAGGLDPAGRQPLGVAIVGDDRIARLADPGGHPPAHLADADDPGAQRAHPSASIASASAGSASANDSTPIPLASSNTSISSAAVAP